MLEKIYLKTQILYGIIIAYIEELEEIKKQRNPQIQGLANAYRWLVLEFERFLKFFGISGKVKKTMGENAFIKNVNILVFYVFYLKS